ncbi:hypothetical protein DKK68_05060 [Bifidobacterium asteroides]|uniref:aldo/keto reductase n=1 Tax=Bifidobacterium asteroides TaxID=1684 RepID=UPI000D783F96|nr:hypothetical protein DKK68_05060 [Bifidobacterium asteroides]
MRSRTELPLPPSLLHARKPTMQQIDHSLERPGMDYVDLIYQSPLGMPRILEEDMDVLHNLVKAGKVRYLDAIAMYA